MIVLTLMLGVDTHKDALLAMAGAVLSMLLTWLANRAATNDVPIAR